MQQQLHGGGRWGFSHTNILYSHVLFPRYNVMMLTVRLAITPIWLVYRLKAEPGPVSVKKELLVV